MVVSSRLGTMAIAYWMMRRLAGVFGRRHRADINSISLALIVLLALNLFVLGCASTDRLPPVPLAMASKVNVDIPDARFYPDTDGQRMAPLGLQAYKRALAAHHGKLPTAYFLAISGGGDDGAFGAGLLNGWTARGDRPEFALVTGVSTGALSAPFAFLGPEYDAKLKQVYTNTDAHDIFSKRSLIAAIANDAMADTTPLRNIIASFVDDAMIQRIAEEYGKGRLLLIMTTNLDQGRSVIWNIGAIASSDFPGKRDLIIDILRASAAIPGLFPPVMLNVSIDGQLYQEMHVDGGAVAQAFLYPPTLNLKASSYRYGVQRKRVAYIIRNGRLFRPEENVKRQTLSIATQAISTMTATSGVNDTYRMYVTTKRDGVGFNLAYIDSGFTVPYKGPFDQGYMRSLFEYGYEEGKAGYRWHKTPPGYQE
jgi:predicted acylesterase/phospholipase RssA